MADFIVVVILIAVVGYACFFIWKQKKSGNKCIGCSAASGCAYRAAGQKCDKS